MYKNILPNIKHFLLKKYRPETYTFSIMIKLIHTNNKILIIEIKCRDQFL